MKIVFLVKKDNGELASTELSGDPKNANLIWIFATTEAADLVRNTMNSKKPDEDIYISELGPIKILYDKDKIGVVEIP